MEYTQNYQLPLWDKEDAVKRTDFNDNNSKIDAALGEQAAAQEMLTAAVAKCGNCKIVYGSYFGTNAYGRENPVTLTFDHKPLFVAVLPITPLGSGVQSLMMVGDSKFAYGFQSVSNSQCTVTWTDTSVSWYSGVSATYQFNSDYTYHYIALLAADE